MKIYLASRYSRRIELCGHRKRLEELGHVITSRWLNGGHQISDVGVPLGENGESLIEGDDGSTDVRSASLRSKFAYDDLEDVIASECLIAFTEPPRSNASRGGRHVELGIAIGLKNPVIIVGPRENIFCWLDEDRVRHFETFDELMAAFPSRVVNEMHAHGRRGCE